ESVVLVVGGRAWRDSSAILEILRRLGGIWSLAYVGVIIPRALRDTLYQFVARRRYRWFGRRQACRIPTPQERKRFL
ncbi:MAG: DCC1-like thiol-disulfide oxidoreductase family protein, partial [Acidobacteria bacterium]|nr:DCC1-like thiol-disulfide oxidoreductase family protein [Acidobacteriota bacterium]